MSGMDDLLREKLAGVYELLEDLSRRREEGIEAIWMTYPPGEERDAALTALLQGSEEERVPWLRTLMAYEKLRREGPRPGVLMAAYGEVDEDLIA